MSIAPASPAEHWREEVETDVHSRLDRLPWSRWHWFVAGALGLVWILDGLEATIVGSVAHRLTEDETLDLTAAKVGYAAGIYLAGSASGALLFGWLNDRLGRRRTFLITLSIYLLGTLATATAFSFWTLAAFRFVTGVGIGGEYVAINSTIGELVPPRVRGRVYLAVNGSWWVGATVGAGLSLVLLEPGLLAPDVGWRLAFVGGGILGLGILLIRRLLPESPRCLAVHGRARAAERIVEEIEERAGRGRRIPDPEGSTRLLQRRGTSFAELAHLLVRRHPRRALLALVLMASQAFFYNAVFYTHGIVLTDFHGVSSSDVGLHLMPLALGNFAGAVTLGVAFDRLGRGPMLGLTYVAAAAALGGTAWLFRADALGAWGMSAAWVAVFFFASAGASGAYLTVAEIFPVEVRGMSFAVFYAVSTGAGGVSGPVLFGLLLGEQSRSGIFAGYVAAAAAMAVAGLVAARLALRAERRSLEDVAPPLGVRHHAAPEASSATNSP